MKYFWPSLRRNRIFAFIAISGIGNRCAVLLVQPRVQAGVKMSSLLFQVLVTGALFYSCNPGFRQVSGKVFIRCGAAYGWVPRSKFNGRPDVVVCEAVEFEKHPPPSPGKLLLLLLWWRWWWWWWCFVVLSVCLSVPVRACVCVCVCVLFVGFCCCCFVLFVLFFLSQTVDVLS